MGRVSEIHHRNLWGRTKGLEHQRNDLWLVDFAVAVKGIGAAYEGNKPTTTLPAILPQYVRSISLPENRVNAETIRQCSIPFKTPSWDEPLEALRIHFLVVQQSEENETETPILVFLNQWLQLVRAGRGLRYQRGPAFNSWFEGPPIIEVSPGKLAMPTYRFSFTLTLIKGAGRPADDKPLTRDDLLKAKYKELSDKRRSDRIKADQTKVAPTASNSDSTVQMEPMTVTSGGLEVATQIEVKDAWLSSYKLSDLAYEGSTSSVTVEAAFYADSIKFGATPQ